MNVSNHQPIDNLLKINPISLNSISIILKALIEDVQQRTGGALDETIR